MLNLTKKGLQILLCEESDQTGSLIYALNLTEKGKGVFKGGGGGGFRGFIIFNLIVNIFFWIEIFFE